MKPRRRIKLNTWEMGFLFGVLITNAIFSLSGCAAVRDSFVTPDSVSLGGSCDMKGGQYLNYFSGTWNINKGK